MTRDLPCPSDITFNISDNLRQHHNSPSQESLYQCSIVVKSKGFPHTPHISPKLHHPVYIKYNVPPKKLMDQYGININYYQLHQLWFRIFQDCITINHINHLPRLVAAEPRRDNHCALLSRQGCWSWQRKTKG